MYDFDNRNDPDMDWYIMVLILLVLVGMLLAAFSEGREEATPEPVDRFMDMPG